MEKLHIDQLFDEAIKLRDCGKLKESVNICLQIVNLYPDDPHRAIVFAVLAGLYSDLKDPSNSYLYFNKATILNPKSEIASLGMYIALCEMEEKSDVNIIWFVKLLTVVKNIEQQPQRQK